MAIFFFVVGLEIKRELLIGELASPRQAALPIAGALGGVVVPALIYFSLNAGGPGAAGWGIPMATDIAFAVGAMALLGSRVPVGLKGFLTALAIVDDIVAVLVIAIFYTGNLSWLSLGVASGFFAALLAASKLGVRHPLPFALLGFCMWVAMLLSGVHCTIAGVLAALAAAAVVGIGFTLSIFIAGLAFAEQPLLEVAKLGIFAASLVAGGTGFLLLFKSGRA
jgi:Na+:H+ antiporter, NhaA family